MCKKSILAVWLATCSLCIAAQEVVSSDQWAATDALGRTVGRYDGTKQDKQVFMFYWTWHQRHEAKGTMVKDNSEILRQYPEARYDADHPA